MGIWSAVRWWEEWQMRILILGSLAIQWFLLLAAPMRKYTVRGWLRRLIWLAYISCDALAIYALATLFNRQAKASSPCYAGVKASSLEVLWAPILLVHLGGREEITAYNIEDNEMWTRHMVTLVSQVSVALYAFYKTWPESSDRRLLWSAILLFAIGILSFCEKPWALRRASINRLVAVSSLAAGRREKPTGWELLFTQLDVKLDVNGRRLIKGFKSEAVLSERDQVQMILSDMSLLAAATDLQKKGKSEKDVLATFSPGIETKRKWLRRAFGLFYTRANVLATPAYIACHLLLVPSLYIAAIVLFATSHKQAYRQFKAVDVRMTYIILGITAVLDVFGVLISEFVYWVMSRLKVPALCETIPGHNLIGAAREMKKPRTGWILRCATSLGYKGGLFHDDPNHNIPYRKISEFVVLELFSSTQNLVVKGLDLASYRSTKRKENWTLKMLDDGLQFDDDDDDKGVVETSSNKKIWESLLLPFDESVLRWHIATDLCFRLISPSDMALDPTLSMYNRCTVAISNYMAHLLNFRPNMLMTGSRQHLFSEARRQMGSILDKKGRLLRKNIEGANKDSCSIISEAWDLSEALTRLKDSTRCRLLYRVWVGMLCYSASMCRGYEHAKTLGEGGEFLSLIWLVLALKGAKTLADKLQIPEQHTQKSDERLPEVKDDFSKFLKS